MVTLEALREAWAEASAVADKRRPTYIRILQRAVEYLVPTDDGRPILIRCRCCQSVVAVMLGADDALPDQNQSVHTHAPSPCGFCRNSVMLPGWTLLGIREAHAVGKTVGLGGRAIPGERREPVEKSAEHEEEPDA